MLRNPKIFLAVALICGSVFTSRLVLGEQGSLERCKEENSSVLNLISMQLTRLATGIRCGVESKLDDSHLTDLKYVKDSINDLEFRASFPTKIESETSSEDLYSSQLDDSSGSFVVLDSKSETSSDIGLVVLPGYSNMQRDMDSKAVD